MQQFFKKKIHLSWIWTGVFFLGISLFLLVLSVWLQAGPMRQTLLNFLHEPLLLILNLFPILAVLGFFFAVFGNLFWSASLSTLLFGLISLVNLIKIECRKDPLVPADFGLLGEAMIATGEYQLNLHIPYIILIVFLAALFFLAGFKFRTKQNAWLRWGGIAAVISMAVAAMLTVYPSDGIYKHVIKSVKDLSSSNVPAVFDETGFLYCFLHNVNLYDVQKPEAYNQMEAEQWARETDVVLENRQQPHVIFVQCEAFSDIYDAPVFSYPEEENPLYLYHRVAESEQAVSGGIVVSNYGAGTANTEFDILTGVETNFLNENSTSAFRVIHKKMPSLARTFLSFGYKNWFMHPGDSWFYNRDSVYDRFGFADRSFVDDFLNSEREYKWKGSRVADQGFGSMLLERFEAHRNSSDAPWFAFTVTIQNHQAYPWSKYDPRPPEVQISIPISDSATETLSVYAEGIRDSSILLDRLVWTFDELDEPTVLVFWGDHLPAMGSSFSVYQEIGLDIGNESDLHWALETYSTPFVIWGNKAFCESCDFAARKEALEMPAKERISDIYLGELVYELLDLRGSDPYFDYLGEARRVLPVINLGRYELPDGSITEELTADQNAVLQKLRCWGYYRVVDQIIQE